MNRGVTISERELSAILTQTEITDEIVNDQQEYMNAFAMVRERMDFLKRTMTFGARFPAGEIFREDRSNMHRHRQDGIYLTSIDHVFIKS